MPSDTGWVQVTSLNSGWAVVGSATVGYRLRDGVVHLRGTITGGTGINVFVLPPGFRPSRTITVSGGNLDILPSGQVRAATGLVGTLDELSFILDT